MQDIKRVVVSFVTVFSMIRFYLNGKEAKQKKTHTYLTIQTQNQSPLNGSAATSVASSIVHSARTGTMFRQLVLCSVWYAEVCTVY